MTTETRTRGLRIRIAGSQVEVRSASTAERALARIARRLEAIREEEERLLALRGPVIDAGKRAGLTQRAAARALGVTEPTITKILVAAGLAPEPTPRPRKLEEAS